MSIYAHQRRSANSLNRLRPFSSILSVVLGIPLIGRLVLGSVLVGLAVLGLLMLIQLPFFAPVLMLERARKRRELEEMEFESLHAGLKGHTDPDFLASRGVR
jgi:hypothetical protein